MSTVNETQQRETGLGVKTYDAIVVGAGFSGIYMLYRLRELGLSARVLEAAPGVGGTWYWNAYPGARCDVESMDYSYSFSPELEQEWTWTERYPSQPEILKYINHVVDRFDLRGDIQLDTSVEAAEFDETNNRWTITTTDGEVFSARYCIMAVGTLSTPLDPPFEGVDSFEGAWYQTQRFPHEGVDFRGKRVGIIGTGSSSIQATPVIAEDASQLYVFQRTPNFSVPARNRPLEPAEISERKSTYREYRAHARYHPFGLGPATVMNDVSALDVSDEERQRQLQERWDYGGAPKFMTSFNDLLTSAEANEIVSEFVRERIREKVKDPEVAELLTPTDHHIATKRLCVDTGYYETFNRDNVTLVDIRNAPIDRITPKGIRLANGDEYEVDIIVFANGFDAMTGTLLAVDFRGLGGAKLSDEWAEGPKNYLGLAMAGFPNLFTITGPFSPTVLAQMIVAGEQHVEWIADCLAYMAEHGYDRVEATPDAQDQWVDHAVEVGNATLFPAANSYYVGANVPGKPRVFTPYAGGFGVYREKCDEVADNDYDGFTFA